VSDAASLWTDKIGSYQLHMSGVSDVQVKWALERRSKNTTTTVNIVARGGGLPNVWLDP
jgi:hypothetical protein